MELLEQLTAALGERYRVEREIGHGGMAVVFLAEDLKHRRRVAIKLLKPELSAALGSERFLREIEIAARDQALHYLERAYEERSTVLAYVLIDPRLAPLRDDSRFLALAQRLGGE
jgi:serine/threonine protein kinase